MLHETLGEQDMFLLEHIWTVVQNCCGCKNLDDIDAYRRLMKSFMTSYKRIMNARPNALSLAQRLPKVHLLIKLGMSKMKI